MADIGVRVGVEGEREFKNAIKSINSDMKVLASEAELVASKYDKNDKSAEAMAARAKVLNEQITKQKEKIEILKNALEKSAEQYGENDEKTKKWQIQLNNAEKELNNLEKSNQDAAQGAKDFGSETEKAADKTEKASNKFEGVGKVMAAVGASIVAAAATITAAAVEVGKALIDMSAEGAAFADTILTESAVTGIATDKLQEYQYAAELIDVSTETLTGTMRKNINAMKQAANGSKTYADAYAQLGVSVTDADGQLRDSETVYWELIDALGQVENETQRDALAMTVLGKSATDLNPLIEAGSERMAELGLQAQQAGYVMGDEALNAFGAFDDQMQYLTVGTTAAKNALGTILLPILTNLAGEGVDLLGQFTNGILDANGDISKMADVVSEMIPQVLDVVINYLPVIVDLAVEIIQSVLTAVTDNAPKIFETAVELVQNLLEILKGILPDVFNALIGLLKSLLVMIVDVLPDLLISLIDMIVEFFAGDGLTSLIDCIFTTVAKLLEKLPEIILKLVQAIPQIIAGIVTAILGNLPTLLKGVITLVVELVKETPKLVVEIVKSIPIIIKSLVDSFKTEGWKEFGAVGKNIVEGLLNGITSAWDGLKKKVTDLFNSLGTGIKKFLGINSPSKVYAKIGGYMADGLGIGFEDEMGQVDKDIRNAIPTNFDIAANAKVRSSITDLGATARIGATMGESSYESIEQTDLLREQNELLRKLLEKNMNVEITNRQIGSANKAYTTNRGMVLNGGNA